jgi:hypothetical protein
MKKFGIGGFYFLALPLQDKKYTITMAMKNPKNKLTEVFNTSSKLRGYDAATIKVSGKVDSFIKNYPLDLWDEIHTQGSKISLVRDTYDKLKKIVKQKDPNRVIVAEKVFKLYKAKRKLKKVIDRELDKDINKRDNDLIEINIGKIKELNKIIKRYSNHKKLGSKSIDSQTSLSIEEEDKKYLQEVIFRKINVEIKNNVLGTKKSRFRSLGKRKET